eukprot:TRINITY_DN38650_c0_g1_i1.p1 TRINITY_DN38650_c0_g1~~TRINITY_DN38650_c0_g1_i1.p1  ORF type:complete len:398 (+),score=49.29 TRINITY_DN38650_c0_g1_i1:83-1276(+)
MGGPRHKQTVVACRKRVVQGKRENSRRPPCICKCSKGMAFSLSGAEALLRSNISTAASVSISNWGETCIGGDKQTQQTVALRGRNRCQEATIRKFFVRSPGIIQTPQIPRGCATRVCGSKLVVRAGAATDDDFKDRASRFADDARRKVGEAGRAAYESTEEAVSSWQSRVRQFGEENGFQGKAQDAFRAVCDARDAVVEGGEGLATEFRLRERAQEFAEIAQAQAQKAESALGVGKKLRVLRNSLRQNLPVYSKQLSTFSATPVGRFFMFVAFFWLLNSGWLFVIIAWVIRLISLGFLMLPLLPYVLQRVARQQNLRDAAQQQEAVQGLCRTCGFPFSGPRSVPIACSRCRSVVWLPGSSGGMGGGAGFGGPRASRGFNGSRGFDKNSPNIIDVEAE